jgi:hypothetical protein
MNSCLRIDGRREVIQQPRETLPQVLLLPISAAEVPGLSRACVSTWKAKNALPPVRLGRAVPLPYGSAGWLNVKQRGRKPAGSPLSSRQEPCWPTLPWLTSYGPIRNAMQGASHDGQKGWWSWHEQGTGPSQSPAMVDRWAARSSWGGGKGNTGYGKRRRQMQEQGKTALQQYQGRFVVTPQQQDAQNQTAIEKDGWTG